MDFRLLLASLEPDRRSAYLREGVSLAQAGQAPRPAAIDPGAPPNPDRLDDLGSAHDLALQRWSVIVPDHGGDDLFARIAPLVALREREQGARMLGAAPGEPFKVPPGMTFEQSSRWIQARLNPLPDARRPRYLLILGGPEQVSLDLQQALSVYYYVGRLAFDDPQGYGDYAKKVVAFAQPGSWSDAPRALAYAVRTESGDDATDDGHEKWLSPIVEGSADPMNQCPIAFKDLSPTPGEASARQLLQLAGAASPTVLISLSHGLGRSRSRPWTDDELRRLQGAMHFGGHGDPLRADDVARGDFLPGGIWFYFACFGAGTPSTSAYGHWLRTISPNLDVLQALPHNGRPFIAALPQAALANRRGPLAIMGHLDLAWSYSYDARLTQRRGQAQRFMRLTRLAGRDRERPRLGPIFHSMMGDLPQVQNDLLDRYDDEARTAAPADLRTRAKLWMLRQDLRAYLLLGDPAVYLPVSPRPKPGPVNRSAIFGFEPTAEAPTPAPAPGVGLDRLVAAVLACIAEKAQPEAAAAELGVPVVDLQRWIEVYKDAGRDALARGLLK